MESGFVKSKFQSGSSWSEKSPWTIWSSKISFSALAAEPLFSLGEFQFTNSLATGILVTMVIGILAFIVGRKISIVPTGIQNATEAILELLLGEFDKVTNDRKQTIRFFPIVASLFIFILLNNWIGLLPGVGTVGWVSEHGLIPFLRPATADLNLTLALAVFSLVVVQVYSIASIGIGNYFSKFVNLRGLWRAKNKGVVNIGVAIIEFFVGLLEIISEFAKVASLSLRLFGNVFAGEVLLGVMLSLLSFGLPLPFVFLEVLVGIIQATVFSMLVLVFLVVGTTSHHDPESAN